MWKTSWLMHFFFAAVSVVILKLCMLFGVLDRSPLLLKKSLLTMAITFTLKDSIYGIFIIYLVT